MYGIRGGYLAAQLPSHRTGAFDSVSSEPRAGDRLPGMEDLRGLRHWGPKLVGKQEEKNPSVSTTTSSNASSKDTPTHTTVESGFEPTYEKASNASHRTSSTLGGGGYMGGGVGSVPEHAGTYMIRDIDSGKFITLVGGKLTVVSDAGTGGGWHWHCEERSDGWIGFCEAVSGRYLGHDNKSGYLCRATVMRDWESFTLRPRHEGGFNLCAKDGSRFKLMRIDGVERPRPSLVDASDRGEATRWEFVKVGSCEDGMDNPSLF